MSELQIAPNKKIKAGVTVVATSLASIAFSGCMQNGGETNAQFRETATPAARYSFDYSAGFPTRINKDGVGLACFEETPYSSDKVVVTTEGQNEVVVIPASKQQQPLHFTGLTDYNAPLQAADAYTASVMSSYGCATQADGDVTPWNS